MNSTDLSWYHYPNVYRQFLSNTGGHVMKVLRDSGGYKHLRFQEPGTSMWYFDLVTWPGSLAVVGDIGNGYVFSRELNMLSWFDHGQEAGHVNPSYWAEKLAGGRHSVKSFSADMFAAKVRDEARDTLDEMDPDVHAEFNAAVEELLADTVPESTPAHEAVRDFMFQDELVWHDTWEWDFTDYDYHFLIACHAILWGAQKYHAEGSGR